MGNKLSICRTHYRTKPDIPQGRCELMHCFAILNSPSGWFHKPVLISPIWNTEYQDSFPSASQIIKATLALPEKEGKPTFSLFLQIFYWGYYGITCFVNSRVDHWVKYVSHTVEMVINSGHRAVHTDPCMLLTICHSENPLYPQPCPQALRSPTWPFYSEEVRPLNFSTLYFLKFQWYMFFNRPVTSLPSATISKILVDPH